MLRPANVPYKFVFSKFGLWLDLDKGIIRYNPDDHCLELEIVPHVAKHTNEKGTVHGGYLQAVADETMRLLVAGELGHRRAVTQKTDFSFLLFALPGKPIVFLARYLSFSDDIALVNLSVFQNHGVVATAYSHWQKRTLKAR